MAVSKIYSVSQMEVEQKINEIIDNLGTGGVTVDTSLSTTSENPVQNKVITNALNTKTLVTFRDWSVS